MCGTTIAATVEPPQLRKERGRELLRLGLLGAALLIGFVPVLRFIGSMLWFHNFLGDYEVFWGIGSAPLDWVYGHYGFPYPVTALLLVRLFGLLPFWPSYVAWGLAGSVAIACASRRMTSTGALALGFCTSAMISVLAGGQTSLFIGALVIAGLSSREPRWRGMFLAAAAVMKPQSLLAAPIALVAERNWRAIGWAIATALALVLLSVLVFGLDTWVRWATNLHRFPTYLTRRGIDLQDVGAYGIVRAAGLPGWAFVIGIPPAIATSWLMFCQDTKLVDRYVAFVCSTVMLSPYTMSYDLAGLSLACTALLLDRERSALTWVAAALIVSSVLANVGIVMMTGLLGYEALKTFRARKRLMHASVSNFHTSSSAASPR
jgi:Glycosyltransferase family 87